MANSKKPISKTINSGRKVLKQKYGLQSSLTPTKPEKPAPKTKSKK